MESIIVLYANDLSLVVKHVKVIVFARIAYRSIGAINLRVSLAFIVI